MQTLMEAVTYKNFINNKWVESSTGNLIKTVSPANTEDIVGYVQSSSEEDLNNAVEAADKAKKAWRRMGQVARGKLLFKVADLLEAKVDDIGKTMTREMGKTLPEAKGEVMRGVDVLRFYANEGLRKEGDVIPSSDTDALLITRRTPLGVVGVITPWNFPVAIPVWKIAPALVYGNTIVLKPATETAVTTAKVFQCFVEAGFPEGVINFVTGSGSVIGQKLIDHPLLNGITFTGSENVGKIVAKSAAERGVKFQLELGGKNPVIIAKDANLDLALEAVINGAFRSTGQKCTATSRVIVEEGIYEDFKKKLMEATKKITVGNGLNEGIWMGPCASESQFNTVNEYIQIGKEEGATLLMGGEVLQGGEYDNGFYITPGIFENVTLDMRIAQEEIFGPVIALIKASGLEEAIEMANNTKYGLSASIFTSDLNTIMDFMEEIETGLVRINAESAGVEYQSPFGGMKASSSGAREQGEAAKEFFTAIKTVFIKRT
ncbi:alpha-ketoglutaric semialdehyde dehydrogenase GucD [Siminovitchia sediminis]|uniref:Alpha-ketoglutaric semialdehyde dehydrogenase GucD n=1 Tax=Siminovitchia sediminis TaxID=1274353 RepID=A0ABW4KK65_9BACI